MVYAHVRVTKKSSGFLFYVYPDIRTSRSRGSRDPSGGVLGVRMGGVDQMTRLLFTRARASRHTSRTPESPDSGVREGPEDLEMPSRANKDRSSAARSVPMSMYLND